MPEEKTPEEVAEALRREALRMAIEYHGQASRHPKSRGMARPDTVTATADQFAQWLRTVAAGAGVTAEDVDQATPGNTEKA